MRRVMIAVVVGVVGGLSATWWLVNDRASPDAPAAEPAKSPSAPQDDDVPPLPRAEDRFRPGLRVTVSDSGHVVAGARVAAWRQVADEAKGGVRWLPLGAESTDANGQATFPAVAGRYTLAARDGAGRNGLSIIDVPIADEATEAQVTLGAGRVMQGRVLDEATKAPVPGALVTAVALSEKSHEPSWAAPAETHLTVPADGLGRFRLEVAAELDVELHAQAPGYAHGAPFPVDRKDAATELTLSLSRAATVEGVVVDASGQAVSGSTVSSEPMEAAPVVSGEAGRFTLTLAPGNATLHAVTPGGLQGLVRVKAGAGEALRGVRVVAAAVGELSGRVVDEAGAGVAAVEVRVLAEPDFVEVANVQTGAHGDFTAVQLPAGRYSLFARSGNGARARQVGVELPLTAPVELRLTSGAHVSGTVVNESGQPLANAGVVLEYARGLDEPSLHARSDATGQFDVADLLPGQLTAYASLGDARSEDVDVYVAPGRAATVTLAVFRRGRLTGRVVGGPPGPYFVFARRVPDGDMKHGFRTDDEGRYDEQLVPGAYELFASSPQLEQTRFEGLPMVIRAGETTQVDLPVEGTPVKPHTSGIGHGFAGSGIGFDSVPGGVAVSFLMADAPAATAGVHQGDLVLSIDGAPLTRSLDAYEKLRRPSGEAVTLVVRRDGQDLTIVVK